MKNQYKMYVFIYCLLYGSPRFAIDKVIISDDITIQVKDKIEKEAGIGWFNKEEFLFNFEELTGEKIAIKDCKKKVHQMVFIFFPPEKGFESFLLAGFEETTGTIHEYDWFMTTISVDEDRYKYIQKHTKSFLCAGE